MGSEHNPYIRPRDLGASERQYTVRIVTDGTRTVAEVFEGDPEQVRLWEGKPIGVGHAVRQKGDKRNHSLGATLAAARAWEDAARNAFEAADKVLNG